ncbi:MAG: MFS transporter [Spirochaetia bacterium]
MKLTEIWRKQIGALSSVATRGFQSLRVRNFRLFWTGQVISLTGTWMQTTAQTWLVLKLTGDSPLALGTVITLQFLPVMVFALFGGVLADRLPKRGSLVATQTSLMIQAAIFGALVTTGGIKLWHVYVLAVIQGLITAIDNPLRQAFLFELVGREDLVNAIGLNSMSFQGARIFGPALAGVVIKLIGIAPALILNAVSFTPVIGALLMMDARAFFARSARSDGSILINLKEGLSCAWHSPAIRSVLIVAAFIGTFGFNFSVIVPLVADKLLKTDATGYGLLSAAMGIGALTAALSTAYARRIAFRRLMVSGALFGLFLGLLALSTSYGLSLLLFVFAGLTGITYGTSVNSLLQLNTPEHLRGRVLSINILLTQGSTPIGGFFIGSLGEAAGVAPALLICAALCLFGVGIAAVYRSRPMHASLRKG